MWTHYVRSFRSFVISWLTVSITVCSEGRKSCSVHSSQEATIKGGRNRDNAHHSKTNTPRDLPLTGLAFLFLLHQIHYKSITGLVQGLGPMANQPSPNKATLVNDQASTPTLEHLGETLHNSTNNNS